MPSAVQVNMTIGMGGHIPPENSRFLLWTSCKTFLSQEDKTILPIFSIFFMKVAAHIVTIIYLECQWRPQMEGT